MNSQDETTLAQYARFRARQRKQRRTRGEMRRSKYLLDLVQGKLERGTRDPKRGPYPAHMQVQSALFHARRAAK